MYANEVETKQKNRNYLEIALMQHYKDVALQNGSD